MTDEKPTKKIKGAPWTMILGEKGAGKTRTAATIANAFCLDTEPPGAASAYPDDYRKEFSFEASMYHDVAAFVKSLKGAKRIDRGIQIEGKDVSCLVLDTFDTVQNVLISRFLEQKPTPNWAKNKMAQPGGYIWSPYMEQRDWGVILNYQRPLFNDLKSLNIPVVIVCHSAETEPVYEGFGENLTRKKTGKRYPAISGSIERYISNLCDYILHIVVIENGERKMYTQPTIDENDYAITAADRHRLFKNEKNDWTSFKLTVGSDGYPTRRIVEFICGNHEY